MATRNQMVQADIEEIKIPVSKKGRKPAKVSNGDEGKVLLEIPSLSIGVMEVSIKGASPLVTHAWGAKAVRQMLEQQMMTAEEKKKSRQNRKAKDPKEDFEQARYVVNGKDAFPVSGVKKAMIEAGYAVGIAKSRIRQAMFVTGDLDTNFSEIKCKKIFMREDVVRVGPFNKRTTDLRYRPEYRDWTMKLFIKFRRDMIDEQRIATLLQNAGFSIGLGEWRPQKDGNFGMFEVN